MLTFWLEASRTRQIKAFKNLLHLNWACLGKLVSCRRWKINERFSDPFSQLELVAIFLQQHSHLLSELISPNTVYIYIYKEFDSEFSSFEVDIFQLIWFLNKISFFPNYLNHVNFNIITLNFNFKSDRAQGRESSEYF